MNSGHQSLLADCLLVGVFVIMLSPWRWRVMSGPKEGILALLTKARPGFEVGRFALVALVAAPPVAAVGGVVALLHPHQLPVHHLLLLPVPRHCIHRVGKLVDSNLPRVQQILQGSEDEICYQVLCCFVILILVAVSS